MKFEDRLRASRVKRWEKHYIDYARLNALIKNKFSRPLNSHSKVAELLEPLGSSSFETVLDENMQHVDEFYTTTLSDLQREVRVLLRETPASPSTDQNPSNQAQVLQSSHKNACIDMYRMIQYLKNFSILNYTGFVKLIRKHDKHAMAISQTHGIPSSNLLIAETKIKQLEGCVFFEDASLAEASDTLEKHFAECFFNGSLPEARAELLMTQNRGGTRNTRFWLGLRCGACLMMGVWVLWDCLVDANLRAHHQSQWKEPAFAVFTSLGCFVLLQWLWGVNLLVWRRYRINHLYILDLDSHTRDHAEMFSEATNVTFVFLSSFLVFYKAQRADVGDFPHWFRGWRARLIPLCLLAYMLLRAFVPWRRRRSLWSTIYNIVISPFGRVRFRHFYVADVLTSLVKPLFQLVFSLCFYISGAWLSDGIEVGVCADSGTLMRVLNPLILALPLWFRFMQCLRRYFDTHKRHPNLSNALKYALAQTVVLMGVFSHLSTDTTTSTRYQILWVTLLTLSTLYTFCWDVFMDWGLLRQPLARLFKSPAARQMSMDTLPSDDEEIDEIPGITHHRPHSARIKPVFQTKSPLREQLMFRQPWIYYTAIFADLIMRFLWTLTLVPRSSTRTPLGQTFSHLMGPVLASIEVTRRCMWSCFRLEAEHLHNTEGYRSEKVIPLHFVTAVEEGEHETPQSWRTTAEVMIFCGSAITLGLISVLLGVKF